MSRYSAILSNEIVIIPPAKKHIIILDHNRGQMANQLWSYMSVYAYCLEKGYALSNPSFGDYRHFFALKKPLSDSIFYGRFKKNRLFVVLRLYYLSTLAIRKLFPASVYDSGTYYLPDRDIIYLPPSAENDSYRSKLSRIEASKNYLYFCGGRFRNPDGIIKYREKIIGYFRPSEKIEKSIAEKTSTHRQDYAHVIGVHIRQTDFKTDKQGHYVEPARFAAVMKEFLVQKKLDQEKTLFIMCSDEPLDMELFKGLHIHLNKGNAGEDLFTLSKTDAIIGSNSSFGAWAAYYGNIPIVVVDNAPLDWSYYENKNAYFENKYCTVVKY